VGLSPNQSLITVSISPEVSKVWMCRVPVDTTQPVETTGVVGRGWNWKTCFNQWSVHFFFFVFPEREKYHFCRWTGFIAGFKVPRIIG